MRIRSLKHKQLIALLLVALTPLFALTASMWMQAQNSKEQAVQTYQGYADTIAIAFEKELDRQKERLEEAAVAAGLLFSSPDNADIRAFEQILYITSGRYSSSIAVNVSGPIARLFFCAYAGSGRKHHHESVRTLVFPANDPERPDNFRGSERFEFRCLCLHWNARFQPQHLSAY